MSASYTPSDDEAGVAWVVAGRRNSLNGGQSNLAFGVEPGSVLDRRRNHYQACLAEIAVSRITNRAWTGCGKGSEGLRDVGGFWDVRSVETATKGLLVRPKDPQDVPFVLVLVEHETRLCTILGWEYPSEVADRGRCLDEDPERICWILPVAQLRALPLPEPI